MTESEWLACTDPERMLVFLGEKAGERKLRLFACACCRRLWPTLLDEWSRQAVEVAESFADGLARAPELHEARVSALQVRSPAMTAASAAAHATWEVAIEAARSASASAARGAAFAIHPCSADEPWQKVEKEERGRQAAILRDIFGIPQRPVSVDPAWSRWNDSCAVKIARAIYEQRRFDDLPVLADALEEAGCTDADILAHCRGPGPHVRGCWVIDLLLGKE
jgi:hypothetical protein